MPVYEYACTACDHRADILHGINDPGPTFCPSCGSEGTMRKLFAPPTIHFKGSGWAKKDRAELGKLASCGGIDIRRGHRRVRQLRRVCGLGRVRELRAGRRFRQLRRVPRGPFRQLRRVPRGRRFRWFRWLR